MRFIFSSASWRLLAMQYAPQLQFQLEENVFRLKISAVYLKQVDATRTRRYLVCGTLRSVQIKMIRNLSRGISGYVIRLAQSSR